MITGVGVLQKDQLRQSYDSLQRLHQSLFTQNTAPDVIGIYESAEWRIRLVIMREYNTIELNALSLFCGIHAENMTDVF